ncbi:uncharacterized protein TrAFT101_011387 [Trichoderma asperellum]|uniref:uncharacterized protein n=1 Tax=Trichoderma asperellum TaxID=101201 RepID=UPI0033315D6D|nr:hypothetical protein TrAFT101_011387 [Trichoderma asperellum]
MPRFKISWVVPGLMVGNTICGILMAVGHHLFYMSLDKQTVGTQIQQEWNARIGTGMAFCVKMFLTAAAGFAYVQVLWRTLKAREVKLGGIDAMFDVVNNPFSFLSWELWKKGFELVVLAGILWAIPIIAVFTPATLTIQQAKSLAPSIHRMSLPLVNFSSPFVFTRYSTSPTADGPTGPSIALARLLSSVAAQGAVLPLQMPFPDAPKVSYTLRFHGPSVSCGPLGGNSSFHDEYDEIYRYAFKHQGNTQMVYVGFVPQSNNSSDTDTSYEHQTLLGLQIATNGSVPQDSIATVDAWSTDHCRVFVIGTVNAHIDDWSASKNTIECGLYNSTYEAQFTFANGTQEIDVQLTERGNGISEQNINQDPPNMYQLAATFIMRGLDNVVVGIIRRDQSNLYSSSQVMSSSFMQAHELQPMLLSGFGNITTDPSNPPTNISLAQIMEQFVANVTVSLFSNKFFLNNESVPNMGNVTVWNTINNYVYSPRNLYIAYGIGIFATLIIVAIGLFCIKMASQSYGKSFSTILRTTRNAELGRLIDASETSGAEPLSKHLADVRLKFWVGRVEEDETAPVWSAFILAQDKAPSYEKLSAASQNVSENTPSL